MREILFKAKRLDNGEWVEGLLTIMWGEYHIIHKNNENLAFPIDENTICQYTGLTDKNGNKIWENDIVKGSHWVEPETLHHFKVDWSSESGLIDFQESPTTDAVLSIFDFYNFGEVEVIGNVFDNPELLQ